MDNHKLARDMPSFTRQDRPAKVKEIYRALKRDHPTMPAEMKARIAARQGKRGKQKQGPPYEAPIKPWKSKEAGLSEVLKAIVMKIKGKVRKETLPDKPPAEDTMQAGATAIGKAIRDKKKEAAVRDKPHPQGDNRVMPTRKEYFAALRKRHAEETKQISPPHEKLKAAYSDPDPGGDDPYPAEAEEHNFDNRSSDLRSEDTDLVTNEQKRSDSLDALKKKNKLNLSKKRIGLRKAASPLSVFARLLAKTKAPKLMAKTTKPVTGAMMAREKDKRRKGKLKKASPRMYGSVFARSGYGTTEEEAWPTGHNPRKARPRKKHDRPYMPLKKKATAVPETKISPVPKSVKPPKVKLPKPKSLASTTPTPEAPKAAPIELPPPPDPRIKLHTAYKKTDKNVGDFSNP
jgi:hypothetical protein